MLFNLTGYLDETNRSIATLSYNYEILVFPVGKEIEISKTLLHDLYREYRYGLAV